MARPVLRRVAAALLAIAGIVVVTFILLHAAPGDPAAALAGEGGDPVHLELLRAEYGLDRPLPQQFLTYTGNLLRGDLGTSIVRGRPVSEVIAERVGPTLLLLGCALVVSSLGGVALGALAARRPYRALDLTVTGAGLVGFAVPAFWLAQLAVLVLGLRAGLFPIQGMTDARAPHTGLAAALDVAHHLVLPAAVLAVSEVAIVARLTRVNLIRVLDQDFVRVARGLGVAPARVLVRHALPNAMVPVMTVIGARFGTLFSGAVLIETVFAWPGLGQLLVSATRTRDYPVLLGLVLLASLSVVVANLVTDVVCARIDPRLRHD